MALPGTVTLYIAGTVAAVLALATLQRRLVRRRLPFPPGPAPLPLLGNLLDLPKEKDWLTYRAWSERYGDVMSVQVFGRHIVILGSMAAVNDLFDKRSAVYSSRVVQPIFELMNFMWWITLLPYGDEWRAKRKLLHAHAHQGVANRYHGVQLASARRLARDVLATPSDSMEALPRAVKLNFGQTIMKMVYGIDVPDNSSEYISLPEEILVAFSEALIPGRYLVDFIPAMKYIPAWFPGAGFQRYAEVMRHKQRRLLDLPIDVVRAQMATDTAPPSMARAMLADGGDLETIKAVTGIAYLAGSDTTVAAIVSFFLAMLVYPEVQAKGQAEVDRVVGTSRLPELADVAAMPYVQSIASECLRWLPVAPIAGPHCTTRDDEYKGFLIPKGSYVIGPVWSILHNAEDYPDPERFNPERYLTQDGQLDPSVRDPRTACFGFGRRICPGQHIANTSLLATVMTLLATIDVVRAKDAQGNEIMPEVDVTTGVLSHPKPFPWAVRPRSRHAEALLTSSSAS